MPTSIPDVTANGLYLLFDNTETLALTFDGVQEKSRRLLTDPEKVPPQVLKAEAFQLCDIDNVEELIAGRQEQFEQSYFG